jgi:hypothetical protein
MRAPPSVTHAQVAQGPRAGRAWPVPCSHWFVLLESKGGRMRHVDRIVAVVVAFGALALGSQRARADENQPCPPGTVPAPSGETGQICPPGTVPAPGMEMEPAPQPVVIEEPSQHHGNRWYSFSPSQIAITAGGGVSDFAFHTIRTMTEVGASWDAKLTVGTRSFFAFEAGYAGTYNKFETSPTGAAPFLVSNGFDTDLRINILPWRVEPYAFIGVGYNRMTLYDREDNPSVAGRVKGNDDQFQLPSGGGLAVYLGDHATIDARFTYRAIFDQGILPNDPNARVDMWQVSGRLGFLF